MILATSFALFALVVPQDPARLLPVPAGWTHERFTLPPSFAPELAWNGVEDLSFAPGMFDTAAPGYFSYGMALSFEADVALDAAALEGFLTSYYGGLYRAVADGKGFKHDATKTHARVTRSGDRFRAHVSTFDAFTDGRALELEMELDVHVAPRATELLALISPKPSDAPIWKELHALGDAWRATRPPEVFLNHVYFVVDRPTYDALAHSSWLREEFAAGEERDTQRGDTRYTGLYLYGRDTYVEFLPDGAAGMSAGARGIVFGVDRPGGLDALSVRFAEHELRSFPVARTRELAGAQVPWFRLLGLEMPVQGLDVLAMEYDARFLAGWHPDLAPASVGIARCDVLERYAAAAKKSAARRDAPFGGVRALTLPVDDAQRERVKAICAAAGYAIEETPRAEAGAKGPPVVECRGPRFRLVLTPASDPGGVVELELELALARPLAREPLRLGRVELSFAGTTARLRLQR